jgi:polyhydroxyalkanoate synthesis regulator phasin
MSDPLEFGELIERLTRTGRLSQREASHVVDEVLAFLDDSLEQFVRRRHRELQREELNNEAIYRQVAQEAGRRRFAVPALSIRQVRRLIYG